MQSVVSVSILLVYIVLLWMCLYLLSCIFILMLWLLYTHLKHCCENDKLNPHCF